MIVGNDGETDVTACDLIQIFDISILAHTFVDFQMLQRFSTAIIFIYSNVVPQMKAMQKIA